MQEKQLVVFSSKIMQWSPSLWIIDLTQFLPYWHHIAQKRNQSLLNILKETLIHTFSPAGEDFLPDTDKQVVPFSLPFRVTMATDPWLAILILSHLQKENIDGLINVHSKRGSHLANLSWDTWWQCFDQFITHLTKTDPRKVKHAVLKKQCIRFQQAATQLGFYQPIHTQGLNTSSIQRRFGLLLANLWSRTFSKPLADQQTIGFPWLDKSFFPPILIKRSLEYPHNRWDTMIPLVCEDLDRLLQKFPWLVTARLMQIKLLLFREDLSELDLTISFRHPHDLAKEQGHHRTTCQQFAFQFDQIITDKWHDHFNDFIQPPPPVIAWELNVLTYVFPQMLPRSFSIFSEEQFDDQRQQLKQIENQLALPLWQFDLTPSWLLPGSFSEQNDKAAHFDLAPGSKDSYLMAGANRPLYLQVNPPDLPLPLEGQTYPTETTMKNWWQLAPTAANNYEESYYKMIGPDGQAWWIKQNDDGKWVMCGQYG